ncbi:aromatic-ring-hydroxylating dioxygenase subunit beta [Sphingobium sp. YBL2]|uniref:aromatic-ring-hydroxylating dioxygenase subunit beta n=1 Tax=Sphingobium sp. (strain YBL2) TaxID=484429 RepID=UPI000624B06B|nr:aromatic-ring-hydroxylating dioxygenase subunit beta [Sphingobium sp. YBL2]AKF40841.1 adoA2 [Sphingobium sp. YBL2]
MNTAPESSAAASERDSKAYKHNPPSLYVDQPYYDWLRDVSSDLGAQEVRPADGIDPALWHRIGALLSVEARLLDQRAYQPWLGLYLDECAYWIPSGMPAPDPRTSVTLEFHDRRRLLDRVERLETGFAYSQYPTSRTARQWSGLEVWQSPGTSDEWRARYSFTLAEFRNGFSRLLAGWNGFVLREVAGELRVAVKQINLIDSDWPQGNNSFFL